MGRFVFRRAVLLKVGRAILAAAVGGAVVLVAAKTLWDARIFGGYEADLPLEAEVVETKRAEGWRTEKVVITGLEGERIPLRLLLPERRDSGRVPCVVFLYGIGQDMRFFEQIAPVFAAHGVALAMPEQFSRGERRGTRRGAGWDVWNVRERASRLVPETRRVVDYLAGRPEIDPARLDFVGASYGGILGCAVVAMEPRLRRAVMVMAGGDFPLLFSSMTRRHRPESRFVWPALARTAAWFVSPFDPLRYVGRIAPRPVLFLNVKDDELIDRACAQALFDAAGQPKEEVWYGGAHDAITEETVRRMLEDALTWLKGEEGGRKTASTGDEVLP